MMSSIAMVTAGPLTNIDYGATGTAEVYQNVKCILSTIAGTVFLDRDFGVAADILDAPMRAVQQRLMVEIVVKVEFYEPRAKVLRVEFVNPGTDKAARGTLVPRVAIQVREDMLL